MKNVDVKPVMDRVPASAGGVSVRQIETAVERLEHLVANYIERAPLLRRRFD